MNKEKYVTSYNLEIDKNIARMTAKIDDKISEVWKIDKADVLQSLNWKQEKENLIKYLEDKVNEPIIGGCDYLTGKMFGREKRLYLGILERLKSGKYE